MIIDRKTRSDDPNLPKKKICFRCKAELNPDPYVTRCSMCGMDKPNDDRPLFPSKFNRPIKDDFVISLDEALGILNE